MMHEYHWSFEETTTAPLTRLFALVPAIHTRHGFSGGHGFIERSIGRAMTTAMRQLKRDYRIV